MKQKKRIIKNNYFVFSAIEWMGAVQRYRFHPLFILHEIYKQYPFLLKTLLIEINKYIAKQLDFNFPFPIIYLFPIEEENPMYINGYISIENDFNIKLVYSPFILKYYDKKKIRIVSENKYPKFLKDELFYLKLYE